MIMFAFTRSQAKSISTRFTHATWRSSSHTPPIAWARSAARKNAIEA